MKIQQINISGCFNQEWSKCNYIRTWADLDFWFRVFPIRILKKEYISKKNLIFSIRIFYFRSYKPCYFHNGLIWMLNKMNPKNWVWRRWLLEFIHLKLSIIHGNLFLINTDPKIKFYYIRLSSWKRFKYYNFLVHIHERVISYAYLIWV